MTRECKQCGKEKELNILNFLQGFDKRRSVSKKYFTHRCRRCHNKNEIQKRKDWRNKILPSNGMYFIRQAVIGHKTEPYFEGENYEYIAPTYAEILKEYK